MEVVIKLPIEVYVHAKDVNNRMLTPEEENIIRDAIISGVVLEPNHGRLIDEDQLRSDIKGYSLNAIRDAETIIESDKKGCSPYETN